MPNVKMSPLPLDPNFHMSPLQCERMLNPTLGTFCHLLCACGFLQPELLPKGIKSKVALDPLGHHTVSFKQSPSGQSEHREPLEVSILIHHFIATTANPGSSMGAEITSRRALLAMEDDPNKE